MQAPRTTNRSLIYWPILIGLVLLLMVASHLVVTGEETVIIEPWQARVIYTEEAGLPAPAALAYSPAAQTLLVAAASRTDLEIQAITLAEDLAATTRLADSVAGPLTLAFDGRSGRLYVLDALKGELVSLDATVSGYLIGTQTERADVSHFGLQSPASMTFDPVTGDLYILDGDPQRILRVRPQGSLGLTGSVALQRGQLSQVGLQGFGSTEFRSIALNPANGHLYLLSAAEERLYEITQTGELIAAYDLSGFDLRDPQGMVFAHTGDPTDDPDLFSLYIADSGHSQAAAISATGTNLGKIVEIMLEPTPQLPENVIIATLVNTIDTSAFTPPSPDSAGITYYDPPTGTGNLIISDSEVNEITPTLPGGYQGANVFESTLTGTLVFTATTVGTSYEPTGVTFNPNNGYIYFSDDDADEIYDLNPGAGNYNDGDESWTSFDTRGFGSTDAEGVAYGNGNLFIVDGIGREVYRTDLAGNLLSQFDVAGISTGLQNPEGIEFDPVNGTLFIIDATDVVIETTTDGVLLQVIDTSAANAGNPGGVALGPPSSGGGGMNLYIADRGVDNNTDPNENDGRVYEMSVSWPLPPVVVFSSPTYSVAEGGSTVVISATLIRPPGGDVMVDYATSDGTATAGAGNDYLAASGTLTLTSIQTTQSFAVTILDDPLNEAPETVNLTLSNPSGGGAVLGSTDTAVLTIGDDDSPPSVQLGNSAYSASESAATADVDVTLSVTSGLTVTVDYATSDITAIANADYGTITGTLTFTPGLISRTLSVPIVSDPFDEQDETFSLTISNPMSATAGAPLSATVTILDDDATPTVQLSSSTYSVTENVGTATISVTLSAASGQVVTVDYFTTDNTALEGTDYTFTSGTLTFAISETVKTISVPITEDALDEDDETFGLTLTNPVNADPGIPGSATITIVDNDLLPSVQFSSADYSVAENAGAITVTVFLSPASGRSVSVDYATADNSALDGSDYTGVGGTLSFLAGETSKTFSVPILDDVSDEGTETVDLTLSNPINAAPGTPVSATLSIIDDDGPPTLRFSSSTYSVSESGGTATITVTLIPASGLAVSVDYATSDGTATAGSDYVATSGALSFAAGETSKTFTVPIIDNVVDEADKTVNLTLSNESNALLGTPDTATLTIVDDDGSVTVSFGSTTYSVAEDGGTATIFVTLSQVSGQAISVDYATSDGTATAGVDYTATSGTLTFAAGETNKSFTIPITDDALYEGNKTVNLTLSNAINGTLGISSASLTIMEDELGVFLPLVTKP